MSEQKKSVKKKILDFIDKYLIWALAVCGLVLTCYGAWFQTEGFTLPDVPLFDCVISMLFGGILSAAMMSYLLSVTKKDVTGVKKLVRKELAGMMRGYIVCFVLFLLLVYFARTVLFFKIGLGGMTFTFVAAWYYLIWGIIEKKQKEKAEASAAEGSKAK